MSRAIKEQELQSEAEKFAKAVELEDAEVPADDAAQGPLAHLQEQFNQLQQQVWPRTLLSGGACTNVKQANSNQSTPVLGMWRCCASSPALEPAQIWILLCADRA